MTTNQAVDDLIKQDLFKLLGLEAISDTEKAALYQKVLTTIQNRVRAQLMDRFSDAEAQQLVAMVVMAEGQVWGPR